MFEASKARPVRLRNVVLRDKPVRPVASPGAPVAWPGGAGPAGRVPAAGGRLDRGVADRVAARRGGPDVLDRPAPHPWRPHPPRAVGLPRVTPGAEGLRDR